MLDISCVCCWARGLVLARQEIANAEKAADPIEHQQETMEAPGHLILDLERGVAADESA